ncbi:aminoglycoside phosphotransferase family protein, partial [Brevundimonas sp.]
MPHTAVTPYLLNWKLEASGPTVSTPSAYLQPVVMSDGRPAMLRLQTQDHAASGADLLQSWAGDGAAQVYARQGPALLMERATGTQNLIDMAHDGQDVSATQILCATAARLHGQKNTPPPSLIPLERWFQSLIAPAHSGLLATCAGIATKLLAHSDHSVPLHGDLHHGNVLDFGTRGWLAIDPKGLLGHPAFEYAVMFTNPDLSAPEKPVAADAFERRFSQIVRASNLPAEVLRDGIIAGAGLSAAWFIEDDSPLAAI